MKKNYMKPESTWQFIGGAEELADQFGNYGSKGSDKDGAWTKGEKDNTNIWGDDTQNLGGGMWDK